MLTFTQASPHRFEARFPVDWSLGFRPVRRETRLFAVIRCEDDGQCLLYVHDKGREHRPVRFATLDTAQRAAAVVAQLSGREFSRLRTLVAAHIATTFGLTGTTALPLAHAMRSAAIARYAIRAKLI
ncbi:hypothetical protein IU450_36080 [Nocardia abscessus]|uniref:hypothetical protein n=1 Tax=Nocardia abscessus TaxID=120957 RepID=UPI00189409D8|nr:hypothetical protein [Nocardia abscessus]MBF6341261.1 hypothetical protein [Nocardia abscessus]